ncbi:FAD-dependent monooxygenase [Streptomyces sp. NPDC046862]|uniref:FAD-dependent monooxygenase n=1 Tax=Streptomyces sp. NPDC046862 TaxID=3154603 RepID=UPI0034554770
MTSESPVIIAGAGPVGLWLAAELRLAGVPVTVLEKTTERPAYTRGVGMHARTLEVLAMRGMAGRPLAEGRRMPAWHFGMLPSLLDFGRLDTEFPFVLAYPQQFLEDMLEQHVIERGATVVRGRTVTGLTRGPSSVSVHTDGPDGPRTFDGSYVVGCDGAGSTVRKAAGIAFPGSDATLYGYLGDVVLDDPPPQGSGTFAGPGGALIMAPLPGGRYRVAGFDPCDQSPDAPLDFEALRASVVRAAGRDFGMRDATWLSRFGNATRQAEHYRSGRVLLAGDAAHMHMPAGGVGMNVGIQDAMNLGWKLAAVARGRADGELLDTYEHERHPIGAALLRNTLAQTALIATFSPEGLALREVLSEAIAAHPALSHDLARGLSGIDVTYPAADTASHPLTGQRVPNLPIGDSDLFTVLFDGRPVLLGFEESAAGTKAAACAAEVGVTVCRAEPWPGQDRLRGVLVRPDGHVWGATDDPALDEMTGIIETLWS